MTITINILNFNLLLVWTELQNPNLMNMNLRKSKNDSFEKCSLAIVQTLYK